MLMTALKNSEKEPESDASKDGSKELRDHFSDIFVITAVTKWGSYNSLAAWVCPCFVISTVNSTFNPAPSAPTTAPPPRLAIVFTGQLLKSDEKQKGSVHGEHHLADR